MLRVPLVGLDTTKSGSDRVKVLEMKLSPIVITTPISLPCKDGSSVVFTGKAAFSIKGEPDWIAIGSRIGQFLGRGVFAEAAAVAGTTAAGEGAFGIETATAVGVGEGVVTLGFASVAAATIYAYLQEVEDIESLRTLQAESSKGVEDFIAGFLDGSGYRKANGRSGRIFNLGVLYGREELQMALARAQRRFRFVGQGEMTAAEQAQTAQAQQRLYLGDPDVPAKVRAAFDQAIRGQFYYAFKRKLGGRLASLGNEYEIRARVGLTSLDGEPPTQPDWSYIFDRTGTAKPPPGHY